MTPEARELFERALAEHGPVEVARRCGYKNHTIVSLISAGKYQASTDRFGEKVLTAFGVIRCPHLGIDIPRTDCAGHALRSVPTSSPEKLRLWVACQACPHKPKEAA
ncbi:MAG: LacI family transcriptional regulator [Pseudomonadota bacterium]